MYHWKLYCEITIWKGKNNSSTTYVFLYAFQMTSSIYDNKIYFYFYLPYFACIYPPYNSSYRKFIAFEKWFLVFFVFCFLFCLAAKYIYMHLTLRTLLWYTVDMFSNCWFMGKSYLNLLYCFLQVFFWNM